MVSSVIGVAAVFALLGGALMWARRTAARTGVGLSLRVLDAVNLGSGRSVAVLQSGKRYFLLGATPRSVSLIAELAASDVSEWQPAGTAPASWPRLPRVAARLRSLRNMR